MRLLRAGRFLIGAAPAPRRRAPPAPTARERWLRRRVRLALPLMFVYAWLAAPTPRALALGAGIAALGLLVRGAAASHLPKHAALATGGPYALTRHPLYLGSAFMAAGFLVAAHSWTAGILGVAYLALFYPAAIEREERKLRRRYGSTFDDYAARVPRFWPRLSGLGRATFTSSWTLYRRNGEYQTVLGFVVVVTLLWLKMHELG